MRHALLDKEKSNNLLLLAVNTKKGSVCKLLRVTVYWLLEGSIYI